LIKALLTGGSVIASPHLTAPFRTLNETEVEAAVSRARAREGAGIA
jgi:hypothetical protein